MNESTNGNEKRRLALHARVVKRGAEGDARMERSGKSTYEVYDSPAADFDDFFADVLAPYSTIRDYAQAWYGSRKGRSIAVEFGGPGRKLFEEVNRDGTFARTAGFVLHDPRNRAEEVADLERTHDVVEADVFFKEGAAGLSWHAVEDWTRDNGKPDMIVQRMVQGVDLIRSSDLYVAIVKRWLSQLADGGTLLAEVPEKMPRAEREKVVEALGDLDFVEELIPSSDLTSILVRI